VLFALLFGITDFGYAFWQWSSAAKALQLGVRLAAVSDPVSSDLKTYTGLSSTVLDGDPMPYYQRSATEPRELQRRHLRPGRAQYHRLRPRQRELPDGAAAFRADVPDLHAHQARERRHRIRPYRPRLCRPARRADPDDQAQLDRAQLRFPDPHGFMGLPPISMAGLMATTTAEDLSGK
jgi:hypothetical protein